MAENSTENNNPLIEKSNNIDEKNIISKDPTIECRETLVKEKAKTEIISLISDIKVKEVYLEDLKNTPLFMD